ncbi:hypothetical protein L917_18476 [Phytophthora nicotianae]|uniref:No apical meristem-associated C-terminal domain-containing protein n=1 Tax=Phytophthora nicotianae TaxID=4792 RepID=W2K7R5_PHYNI|nr:hypothetical protein L917_18476 [Phytophthora nicotianae]
MTTPTLGLPTTLPPSWAVVRTTSDASGTRTEVASRTVRSSGWTPFASTDDIRPATTKLDCFLDKTRLKRWDRVSLTRQMIGRPVTSMYSCGMIVVFTDRSSSAGAKRTPPETSSIGIYASNKPARVGKCMIRKEFEEAKAHAEVEDRREDREGPLAAERAKRKEWRQKTREEAAAAIMGINDQMRRETAATVEERLQYEERFERDCNELRQRHQELMMMLSVMQHQDSDKHC